MLYLICGVDYMYHVFSVFFLFCFLEDIPRYNYWRPKPCAGNCTFTNDLMTNLQRKGKIKRGRTLDARSRRKRERESAREREI